jgi:hypothetical protein
MSELESNDEQSPTIPGMSALSNRGSAISVVSALSLRSSASELSIAVNPNKHRGSGSSVVEDDAHRNHGQYREGGAKAHITKDLSELVVYTR